MEVGAGFWLVREGWSRKNFGGILGVGWPKIWGCNDKKIGSGVAKTFGDRVAKVFRGAVANALGVG